MAKPEYEHRKHRAKQAYGAESVAATAVKKDQKKVYVSSKDMDKGMPKEKSTIIVGKRIG